MKLNIEPKVERTIVSLIKDKSKSNTDIVNYICNNFNLPIYEASDLLQKITYTTMYKN